MSLFQIYRTSPPSPAGIDRTFRRNSLACADRYCYKTKTFIALSGLTRRTVLSAFGHRILKRRDARLRAKIPKITKNTFLSPRLPGRRFVWALQDPPLNSSDNIPYATESRANPTPRSTGPRMLSWGSTQLAPLYANPTAEDRRTS